MLYSLAEGIRVLALLLCPYMPRTSIGCWMRSAKAGARLDAFGAREGGQTTDRIEPLFQLD